jgi:hypothetical protein
VRRSCIDVLHGDAILHRADQRAEIAADAFLFDDSRDVYAHAVGILFTVLVVTGRAIV